MTKSTSTWSLARDLAPGLLEDLADEQHGAKATRRRSRRASSHGGCTRVPRDAAGELLEQATYLPAVLASRPTCPARCALVADLPAILPGPERVSSFSTLAISRTSRWMRASTYCRRPARAARAVARQGLGITAARTWRTAPDPTGPARPGLDARGSPAKRASSQRQFPPWISQAARGRRARVSIRPARESATLGQGGRGGPAERSAQAGDPRPRPA